MSSSSSSSTQPKTDFIKPLVGGLVAGGLDNWWLLNKDYQSNAIFGATVAGSLYATQMVSGMIPALIPTAVLSNGKTVQERLLEISAGSAGSYAVNKYIFNNEYRQTDMMKKIAIVAVADFIGEYASDYMNQRQLSYFY